MSPAPGSAPPGSAPPGSAPPGGRGERDIDRVAVPVDGVVAGGGDLPQRLLAARHRPRRGHRQPALGEGAGLVGADHTGRAEGLHRGQPADDDAAVGHPPGAERERGGDGRGQALRDGGDGQRHPGQQHLDDARGAFVHPGQAEPDGDGRDRQREQPDPGGGRGQVALQRCPAARDKPAGDLPDLAVRAGHRHGGATATGHHQGAGKHLAGPVRQRQGRIGHCVHPLAGGHRLAGQGRLVHPQRLGVDEPGVGRDPVAGREFDQVAGHQVGDRDPLRLAVAQHHRRRRHHRGERVGGRVRPRLLGHRDGGVQHDDQQDGGALGDLTEHQQADQPGGAEQQGGRVGELGGRAPRQTRAGRARQFVRSGGRKPGPRLLGGQPEPLRLHRHPGTSWAGRASSLAGRSAGAAPPRVASVIRIRIGSSFGLSAAGSRAAPRPSVGGARPAGPARPGRASRAASPVARGLGP